jgi:phage shock protein PspC (stress-responsive transcriptional regulator)
MEKKLYRSRDSKKICGVCGGLAKYCNMDPTVMRLLAVVVTFCAGFGLGLLAYVIAAMIMPEEPEMIVDAAPKAEEVVEETQEPVVEE